MKRIFIGMAAIFFLWCTSALAVPVTFFGEDLGIDEFTRLDDHPNADAARDDFFSHLVGVTTEDFESFPGGMGAPLAVDFGIAGTATLEGAGMVNEVPTGTNFTGRYPISGDKYWESGASFSILFTEEISAFGFYGVDIGDFDGQVTLTYTNGTTNTINIGNTIGAPGGSVLYFGFYDLEQSFVSIEFGNTEPGADFFGFDDFTIATINQIDPPDPVDPPDWTVPALSGTALNVHFLLMAGLGFFLMRRKAPNRE
jgi:hypothetical protein